jgi:hypothetical protein
MQKLHSISKLEVCPILLQALRTLQITNIVGDHSNSRYTILDARSYQKVLRLIQEHTPH